ncbi:hypothetical protein UFOVP235_7 [uncultured Caudovirales phage]|uniref:Uncharacterized protein n=1 Tax=uncultured Caudovirales phage TaxID=2100421 RepID=A0A6J7WR19_9CAUD|nr:hypothetical protein UFOVP235_7 [uncultured Caudovirales phage]
MSNADRFELANRADLLQEVCKTLRQDRNFWLRQKDFKRVAELRRRIRLAEERLASVMWAVAQAA